jgi:peptidoglycan hydrolase CwlO-like protein
MISNLASARALLQADLEHARNVLDLWAHQVAELEKALAQLDAVVASRDALRGKYQALAHAAQGGVASLPEPARRGRKPGATAAKAAKDVDTVSARKADAGKRVRKQPGKALPARYKDPASDKTWSGRGRRPAWLVGEPDKYAI